MCYHFAAVVTVELSNFGVECCAVCRSNVSVRSCNFDSTKDGFVVCWIVGVRATTDWLASDEVISNAYVRPGDPGECVFKPTSHWALIQLIINTLHTMRINDSATFD